MSANASFRRDQVTGEIVGVITSYSGNVYIYDDLVEFRRVVQDSGVFEIPYLDFILRPVATTQTTVNWDKFPDSTVSSLKSYQADAIKMAVETHHGRSLIAADTGTGKTLLGSLIAFTYPGKRLFIVTTGKLNDWASEWKRWTGDTSVQVFTKMKDGIVCDTVVTTYAMVRTCQKFQAVKWTSIVVDECQNIKHKSKQTIMALKLITKAPVAILMSATPQESRPRELFNALHGLYPDTFSSVDVFTKRYSKGYEDRWGKWVETGAMNQDELNALIGTLMYRIEKMDALDTLPPKTRHIVHMECVGENLKLLNKTIEDKRILQEQRREVKTSEEDERFRMRVNVATNLIHHTACDIKAEISRPWIETLLATYPDDKVVFFTDHHSSLHILETHMEAIGVPFVSILGTTPKQKRSEFISQVACKSHPTRVLLTTYKTCAVGVELSPGARIVVLCDPAHLPPLMTQAEDRVWRMTTENPVDTFWWVLEGSTDQGIVNKIQTRYRDNTHIIDGKQDQQLEFAPSSTHVLCKRFKAST